jgi:hypothetical protein
VKVGSEAPAANYLTYLFDDLTSRCVACLTTILWPAAYRGPFIGSSERLIPTGDSLPSKPYMPEVKRAEVIHFSV